MAPHSAALQHQAQARHTDAATPRTEVNWKFERPRIKFGSRRCREHRTAVRAP